MKKKILVVDDCPIVLEMMQYHLEGLSYEVTTASNGLDACTLLESSRYNLIFTDLNMPGMNGIELTMRAKKMPNCKFVPIVMLSAENEVSKQTEAKAVGIATFLQKPIQENQLTSILNVVLGDDLTSKGGTTLK